MSGNRPIYGLALLQDDLLTRGVIVRRIFAWLIDVLLITFVVASLWWFFLVLGALPLVPILYHWLFLSSPMSATPGQAMLGLVVRRNDDMGPPSALQALASTVLFYITLLTGVIWLGVALLTVRRRTIHDLISGLVVVRARALTPASGVWNMPPGGPPAA